MFTEFLAFFLRVCYIISVNCGMSLRSILKGVGCVRPSFNLAGKVSVGLELREKCIIVLGGEIRPF